MKNIRVFFGRWVLLLGLLLASCAPVEPLVTQTAPEAVDPVTEQMEPAPAVQESMVSPQPVSRRDPGSPEGVAVLFFEAYLEAAQNRQPTLGHADFTAQQYLSEAYMKQVAEIKAGFEGFGFDPILQAQDVPPAPVEVKDSSVMDHQATVSLQFGRGVIEQPWERTVSLEQIDGTWLIVPDQVQGGEKSPQETVQAFYDWYLGYMGSGEEFRNPLVDRAYRAAPYLSAELVYKVDRMAEEGLQFDPFLCAQDIPGEIKPVASFYNDARPSVVMRSDFSDHYLIADLARANFNLWAIRNITCGNSPAGFAKAFYTWVLDYTVGGDELRNLWVDGAYRNSGFLSQDYIAELDRLVSSGSLLADPVLLAQDFPRAFSTAPCREANCALVNLQFGDATIRQLKVEVVEEAGALRIAGVRPAVELESAPPTEAVPGVEHWAPFKDEPYGYTFWYPAGWQIRPSSVTDLHTPEEYWVMRTVSLQPAEAEIDFIPLMVEVLVGEQQAVEGAYPAVNLVEVKEINGYQAQIYHSDPGIVQVVFAHPTMENVWVVFTDAVSQFPGREALASEVAVPFEALLSTVAFSQ